MLQSFKSSVLKWHFEISTRNIANHCFRGEIPKNAYKGICKPCEGTHYKANDVKEKQMNVRRKVLWRKENSNRVGYFSYSDTINNILGTRNEIRLMKGKANRMGVEEGVPAHDLRWTTRCRKAALKKMLTLPSASIWR